VQRGQIAQARRLGRGCAEILEEWQALTREASGAPMFAAYWLQLEALQEAAHTATVSTSDGPTYEFDLSDEYGPDAGVTLRRIVWNIDVGKPWRSYVTQEIDISASTEDAPHGARPISLLVLDTAQYYFLPAMDNVFISGLARILTLGIDDIQLAGTHGNVLETQVESVDWMISGMKAEERQWVVATHHPYDDLGRVSPPRFDAIREAGGIPVTLSAHTHAGEIRWNHDGKHEGDWLEINVGSLLDAPAEFRDFQVHRLGDRLAVTSNRFTMRDVLRERGLLEDGVPGYRPSPGDPDSYLNDRDWSSLSEVETERAVKRVLLAAYLRMFRLFATDTASDAVDWPVRSDGTELSGDDAVLGETVRMEKMRADADLEERTHLLHALREFDRTRPIAASERQALRAYRLSQAIWSAEAEFESRSHTPPDVDPDISFLLLPAATAEPPGETGAIPATSIPGT
jgi:hypothetical protein